MSYANRKQMSSNRTVAIVVVALIHVALGYALALGMIVITSRFSGVK